jgi:hypothetical protein
VPLSITPECFCYLSENFISLFQEEDWKLLKDSNFIPIVSENSTKNSVLWMKPTDLVFENEAVHKEFGNLFDYVPSSYGGRKFLKGCKVLEVPDEERFATSLIRNHGRYVLSCDVAAYLRVLYQLRDSLSRLKPPIKQQFKETQCFLAFQGDTYQLRKPSEIVLVDNQVYCDIFQPFYAPRELEMETMYESLGSKWLTSCISTSYSAGM